MSKSFFVRIGDPNRNRGSVVYFLFVSHVVIRTRADILDGYPLVEIGLSYWGMFCDSLYSYSRSKNHAAAFY